MVVTYVITRIQLTLLKENDSQFFYEYRDIQL